jgi:[protein-PII] uridylyltransferase
VLAAKEKLAAGRETLRRQHDSGTFGIQLCSHLTDLVDTLVLDLYQAALAELGPDAQQLESEIVLVPHSGYGRRDMVPFSDVDLMLLRGRGESDRVDWLAKRLVQDLSDAGFHLGFCVRTVGQACSLALKDPTVFTSLVESRYLTGSVRLFSQFFGRFRHQAQRHSRALMAAIIESRNKERRQFGETAYLLEPNVKRSRGALRDIHLWRWIGFARYGECVPSNLMRMGVISPEERDVLRRAQEFLLRLRNELHFHSGQAKDVLVRSSQVRIAELFGYQGGNGLLPVEEFMRDYFHHTSEVGYTVDDFVATAQQGSRWVMLLAPLFSHTAGPDYRVGPVHIRATRSGREKLKGNLTEVLRLMELSNLYDKWIDHSTWTAIRDSVSSRDETELPPEAASRFLALIAQPGRLGELLRRLHRLRVLERIIPGMAHARCLLQFNGYHKYTVDEHSFRTVEWVTDFLHDTGPLGDAYRAIKQKRTLHLAALIHDLGKGYPGDHSEVGRQLAQETAALLGLPPRETETLTFLVHKHLLLSHLAQRRDINDSQVPLQLAVEVGSPDVLQMLYVLTCADLAAVGPGVLNDWKKELITELYARTMRRISEGSASAGERTEQARRRQALLDQVGGADASPWWKRQIESLPANCLFYDSPSLLLDQL